MNETVARWRDSFRGAMRSLSARAELTVSIKMAVAASLSFLAGQALGDVIEHPSTVISGLWCVMASIVVMQSRLGGTYKAVWSRFLGILIGSLAGGVFIDFFGEGSLSILIGVFLTVAMCSICNLKDSVRIAGLSTAMIIILGGAKPEINPWSFTLFRFLDSCIGMIVSLSVAYFLWPEKAMENMRLTSVRILGLLAKNYRLVTSLDKRTDDSVKALKGMNSDIVELIDENRTYCAESELELFDRDNLHEHWKLFVMDLETLFEMVITLGRSDHASVGLIIDDQLAKTISKIVDETDVVLLNIEKELSSSTLESQTHDLKESLGTLNEELERFRQTRATRKFSLEDVENYFVYFYSLKSIGDHVLKMEALAKKM